MPTAEMRTEVRFRDPPLIAFAALGPCTLVALHLPSWLSLLVAVFLPFLLLSHVLLPLWLLHLTFVLLAFRVAISTLRLLRRPPLVLRSHFAPVSALRLLIFPILRPCLILAILWPRLFRWPSLFLAILRLRIFRPLVFVFFLGSDG
jgi:hypothetical protein